MDPEEKFLEGLRRKKKNDMHLRFFEENGELQFILSPIFTLFSGKKRIQPYRNISCGKADCVYDENELISRFKQSGLSNFITFICHTCRRQIQLSKFFFDESLEEIIEDVWKNYNKSEKIVCERVRIFRDGIWEPLLPQYIKNLDENLRKALKGEEDYNRKIVGENKSDDNYGMSSPPKKQVVIAYKNIIKLTDFDKQEYNDLQKQYNKEGNPMGSLKEVMINRYGCNVLNSDYVSIQNETWFNSNIMSFFIQYLEDWSNRIVLTEQIDYNNKLYNKKYPVLNKARFLAVAVIQVINYDPFYHIAKYSTHCDNFSHIKQRLSNDQLLPQIDKVYIVLNYDQRWILAICDCRTQRVKIVDYLQDILSRVKKQDVLDIVQFILNKSLYPLKVTSIQDNDEQEINQINYYSDCGFYIATYLYKAMILNRTLGDMPYFTLKVNEKNNIKDMIPWLFLKYFFRDDGEQKIQLNVDISAARDSDSEEESQRNKNNQSKQQEINNSLMQDWNLNANQSQSQSSLSRSINKSRISSVSSFRSEQSQQFYDLQQKSSDRQSQLLKQDRTYRGSILGSLLQNAAEAQGDPNFQLRQITPSDASYLSDMPPINSKNRSNASNNNRGSIQNQVPQKKPLQPAPPPYFQATKGELADILKDFHEKLLEDASQERKKKEEQELRERLLKEKEFVDQMDPFDARQALNFPTDRIDQSDLEKLSELQKRQYIEKREKFHSDELDRILEDGLQPDMLEQLSPEDLGEILIRYYKLKVVENPQLHNNFSNKQQLLNSIQSGNADPFYNYIGLDFNELDQNEYGELTDWNRMLQQGLIQAMEKKRLLEQEKPKHSSKRSKSKNKKKKKPKDSDKDKK